MSADINLGNIGVTLRLPDGVDVGLDDVNVQAQVGANLSGSVDVGLDDVRTQSTVNGQLDVGLNDIRIRELPEIRTNSRVDLGLDDIRIRELPQLRFELSFRPIRIHLPLNYTFCLELFGVRIFKFAACGEGMAIAEDYVPHETERCG